MADKRRIIMFVKVPEKGVVKSRLIASVGEGAARLLYQYFVDDLIEMLRMGGYPFVISFDPPDAMAEIRRWLGKKHIFIPQAGDDLGERMKNAFAGTFSEGVSSAVLIGSDSPDLTKEILAKAFAALDDHNTVIGPSHDGGYYLIGFNKNTFMPEVFNNIPWSTPEVFSRTMDILIKGNCRVHVLPEWRDIDTIDDLRALFSNCAKTAFAGSETMKYLRKKKGELL
ncbi:MAG: TIGR04282 family arsenosugar biosynthesis glycosyltransferase [Syntrophorhabdaceae bacterium]|nr:TIGR04282 family arsenosugar biosynthesis glycosyltransferase [Syntrophorhabdaceae bacterium]MDD5243268.1 TIGR04282 family arsenosugar biosynthesis glycosyltransferase [Syntrophorhabdaceae bacterium]